MRAAWTRAVRTPQSRVANDLPLPSLILDDVTCTFAPGTMTCIMGALGLEGKSTLLKLLMRFWDPAAGTITVSGVDARHINTASLRSHEGLYDPGHASVLRHRTREPAGCARQRHRCRAARRLPLRLAHRPHRPPAAGDSTRPLPSWATRFRAASASASALRASSSTTHPFILLDEPTSALDALNEASVMQAVDELKRRSKTIVLVSSPCQHLRVCRFLAFGPSTGG